MPHARTRHARFLHHPRLPVLPPYRRHGQHHPAAKQGPDREEDVLEHAGSGAEAGVGRVVRVVVDLAGLSRCERRLVLVRTAAGGVDFQRVEFPPFVPGAVDLERVHDAARVRGASLAAALGMDRARQDRPLHCRPATGAKTRDRHPDPKAAEKEREQAHDDGGRQPAPYPGSHRRLPWLHLEHFRYLPRTDLAIANADPRPTSAPIPIKTHAPPVPPSSRQLTEGSEGS